MKFIKMFLLFFALHVALPTSYAIILPTSVGDTTVKQKYRISNGEAVKVGELLVGISILLTSVLVICWSSLFIQIDVLFSILLGTFFLKLGVFQFLLGLFLVIHSFVRRSKKRQNK